MNATSQDVVLTESTIFANLKVCVVMMQSGVEKCICIVQTKPLSREW